MDPYADNSIGNVTGSNSVNVFLGCGLAWSIGALYWASQKIDESATVMKMAYNNTLLKPDRDLEPNELWLLQFQTYDDSVKDNILKVMGCKKEEACSGNFVFMVPAGSLWFNLLVFSCNAGFAI